MDHVAQFLPIREVLFVSPVTLVKLRDQRILEVLMRLTSLFITFIPAKVVTQTTEFERR